MLLKKIPKRTILFDPRELKDIWGLLCEDNIREGNYIEEFEEEFKNLIGVKETIAVSSGRFALYLILDSLGVNKGDGVLLSAYNFKGVPRALIADGFDPIFVDADDKTYQIDINQIEKHINSNVKAILVTHLFGQPSEINDLKKIADKYDLYLIEDSAHSLGSYYKGEHMGSLGDAGFFSLSGSKVLNTSFGGIVVTNNHTLAKDVREKVRSYNYPSNRQLIRERMITYVYALLTNRSFYSITQYPVTLLMSMFGFDPLEVYKSMKRSEITEKKMKFTNYQALIALRQMKDLDNLISKRRSSANKLLQKLETSISRQIIPQDCSPNYFMIALKAQDKFKLYKELLLSGIDSNLDYASDCSFLKTDVRRPVAQELSESIITLNLPFNMSDKEINDIAHTINRLQPLVN